RPTNIRLPSRPPPIAALMVGLEQAEGEGVEPSRPFSSAAFEAAAIAHWLALPCMKKTTHPFDPWLFQALSAWCLQRRMRLEWRRQLCREAECREWMCCNMVNLFGSKGCWIDME